MPIKIPQLVGAKSASERADQQHSQDAGIAAGEIPNISINTLDADEGAFNGFKGDGQAADESRGFPQHKQIDPLVGKPNPFDPESLRLPDDEIGDIETEAVMTSIEVRKPKRDEFVRTHPSQQATVATIELDREIYLVDPSMRNELAGEWTPTQIRVAVNRDDTPFLWPVKQAKQGERQLGWHASAKAAAAIAENSWVRVKANMTKGAYDAAKAVGELEKPRFPEQTLAELLELGFGNGRLIDAPDHPIVKRLRGEE